MPPDALDLLSFDRGAITAPAGCGKTHLIADALMRHRETQPVLVLTHTNAGVVALRARLDRLGVPASNYRLSTIDGWALRLISTFPLRSGHDPQIVGLHNPRTDYPNVRAAAARLLQSGHINDVLKASYSRLIVDEYQDCSKMQHAVVYYAAVALRTCVLGDPLQAIFGFGGDVLPHWENEVCRHFPIVGQLSTPWRWINAGCEELGEWLLDARGKLIARDALDLSSTPHGIRWVVLDGKNDHKIQLEAGRTRAPGGDGNVLIVGESTSPRSQHLFASQTPGATTVESVDLRDLVAFARTLDLTAPNVLNVVLEFGQSVMTGVDVNEVVRRVDTITQGRARKPANDVESAALAFSTAPSYRAAAKLLEELGKQSGTRTVRTAVIRACMKALQLSASDGTPFVDACVKMREQNRLLGRPLPKRAVGSTLLLKGLEAEVVVVLDAHKLNARNLYVAMTRGSKLVVVCSPIATLQPR